MAKTIKIEGHLSKEDKYKSLVLQIKYLIEGEPDLIANMANVSAVLKQSFSFLWVGFYIVKENELVLGPFQGSIACTRIRFGKGVCGMAWKNKQTIIVPNVHDFEGHIVCDSGSLSEIVVPIILQDSVIAVLDVDSEAENHFDEIDAFYLKEIVSLFKYN